MVDQVRSPNFTKSFVLDYFFEEEQKLLFMVTDVDNPDEKINQQDFIGMTEITLGNVGTMFPINDLWIRIFITIKLIFLPLLGVTNKV